MKHCVVPSQSVLSLFKDTVMFQSFFSNGGDRSVYFDIRNVPRELPPSPELRVRQLTQEDAKESEAEHLPALAWSFPHDYPHLLVGTLTQ